MQAKKKKHPVSTPKNLGVEGRDLHTSSGPGDKGPQAQGQEAHGGACGDCGMHFTLGENGDANHLPTLQRFNMAS